MPHLSAFCNSLAKEGFDAAILTSTKSQRYLAGFVYSDGYLLITPQKSYLITDFRYEEEAKAKANPAFEVVCPTCTMAIAMAGYLTELGAKRVAVEEGTLTLSTMERLQRTLSDFTLESGATRILGALMEFKDEQELDCICRAQRIADDAFSHILKLITPDMTEMDVALELEFFMRRNGSSGIAFETIAVSGSASSLPHGHPRRRRLARGFLTMDFGACVDGYRSDMTRTVVLGTADADMKRLYNTVLSAQCAALDAAAEGISCFELDRIAREIIEEKEGYAGCFGHSLGHGVGLNVHESPRLARTAPKDSVLRRGHVVTVEPGIYIAGRYGCRIEDMIAVLHDGSVKNLTASPKELIELF